MKVDMRTRLGARFKFLVHKGDGVPVRETEWFCNIVLNSGLVRMSAGTWVDRCCVGTGNSTPSISQTRLDNFLASTSIKTQNYTSQNTTTSPFYYGLFTTWRFGEGVAAGNISEVGLGWGDVSLWNRALIKDAAGNPTTLTVLSDEYLDVISEIRVYPQQSISGGFNKLSKTGAVLSSHTYTGLPVFISPSSNTGRVSLGASDEYGSNVYSGNMGSLITSAPTDMLGTPTSTTQTNPTQTSVRLVMKLGLTSSNGIHRSFRVNVSGLCSTIGFGVGEGYKLQIEPPITKTNTIEMTYTFELSWGRYEPT